MNNYELILNLSASATDKLLRPIGLKMLEKAEDAIKVELWKFWKPFREYMKAMFSVEESKNGHTFIVTKPKSVDSLLSKVKYDKLCKSVEETFGVTSFVIKKKDFPIDLKMDEWKFMPHHIPFIIAYELDSDQLFKVLTIVGEEANILWIKKED